MLLQSNKNCECHLVSPMGPLILAVDLNEINSYLVWVYASFLYASLLYVGFTTLAKKALSSLLQILKIAN